MSTAPIANSTLQSALAPYVATLRRLANYALPPALDRRVLGLAERKESLSPDEYAELLDWVTFTQQRSADKLEAEVALRRLAAVFPELMAGP